jgi:Kef-type K+ transport system membrane component KefB
MPGWETVSGSQIPFSLLLVFASAKLAAEIFERLGQPGIVGEIIAGVLIGPHVLGWMSPNQMLRLLSDLGVMFLLFRVGLEVKSSELMRTGGIAVVVAVSGVIVPFVMGWGISALWGESRAGSVFIGAAMVATSVGITAQVLASRGLLKTRAANIILAAAVVDDILGLIVLAMVRGFASANLNFLDLGLTAAIAVAFVLFIAGFGSRTATRVLPRMRESLRIAEGEFAIALTLLFALSLLAVYAGVAAIVGAFLAGMALSESVDERVCDLTNGVAEWLVPFFLAGIGLQLDLSTLRSGRALGLAAAIVFAAVISKFLGCGGAALRLGRADAIRVGVGMVPRGEVGMVVAQIGLGMGAMAPAIYGVVVLMSIATTLIAPPLLKLAFANVPADAPEEVIRLG